MGTTQGWIGGKDQEILEQGNKEFSEKRWIYKDKKLSLSFGLFMKACNHTLTNLQTHSPTDSLRHVHAPGAWACLWDPQVNLCETKKKNI